jgi:D-threo-aldose 1-dehydrogenase
LNRKRLGYGCAGLMRTSSRRQRQRLLGEAFERGIRHFDVARMYGLGAAEGELGRFARGRREELLIATKFGIDPAGGPGRLARFQAPARAALKRMPRLRAAVKRRQSAFQGARRYDAATARASLETSLRELGTDYVDIFFVHGPEAGDEVDVEGLAGALEELRHAGRIRAWGLAGDAEPCLRLQGEFGGAGMVLQIRDEALDSPVARAPSGTRLVTFGVLERMVGRILECAGTDAASRSRWAAGVGSDCTRADAVAGLLLQDALDRNSGGTVLFSTSRPERIAAAVEAAVALDGDSAQRALGAFREWLRTELGGSGG